MMQFRILRGSSGVFFCDCDEARGHHACMNGHLPTARQRQDMCAYSGGGGESGGSVGKIWKRLLM